MPPMTQPPMAPDVQAQMGPGPKFGAGVEQAQSQMGKNPIELAVGTVEKILQGIQGGTPEADAFKPFAQKAIATLKVGLAQSQSKQPQSAGIGAPPQPGQGPSPIPTPPTPGQMPV